jgi:hypothetical protein
MEIIMCLWVQSVESRVRAKKWIVGATETKTARFFSIAFIALDPKQRNRLF